MKRFALTSALLSLAFAASAQNAAPAAAEPTAPQAAPANAASVHQDKNDAKDEIADRNCLKHTGSRVIRADSKGRKCAIAAGRAYNRDDIDRTGAIDLKDAIRKLDPAVH
ncbi:MAG: hypothetical protein ACREO0_15690 [Pseudoxanthomonas sp.]